MSAVVAFGDALMKERVDEWSKKWPNVSIKTWSLLSEHDRQLLRNFLDEDEPDRIEVTAFLKGVLAANAAKRKNRVRGKSVDKP